MVECQVNRRDKKSLDSDNTIRWLNQDKRGGGDWIILEQKMESKTFIVCNLLLDCGETQKCLSCWVLKVFEWALIRIWLQGTEISLDQLKQKGSVLKETGMLHQEQDPCTGKLAKIPYLFSLSFSACLLHILHILSLSSLLFPLFLPSHSHLWKKMASLQFPSLPVTVPDTSETDSPSLLPSFRFPVERILLTQPRTHSAVTRGTGFKIETWLQGTYPVNKCGGHLPEKGVHNGVKSWPLIESMLLEELSRKLLLNGRMTVNFMATSLESVFACPFPNSFIFQVLEECMDKESRIHNG